MTNDTRPITISCSASPKEMRNASSLLIPSLARQERVGNIRLILVNYTGQGKVYGGDSRIGNKLSVEEINNGKQLGFGEAHNLAFEHVSPEEFFIIINPDVYLRRDFVSELVKAFRSDKRRGLVEARQAPFEHPKEYDPVTRETPWASGFGLLINAEFFRKAGGFDEKFWMYCEDVDLSWRSWILGYPIYYCREAVAYHFTGGHFEYRPDRFYLEHFWGARNFLYIMFKFWGERGLKKAYKYLNGTSYPKRFKKDAWRSFQELKGQLADGDFFQKHSREIRKLSDKIKVTGFNRYNDTM